jgi:hypothetical protein
MMTGHKGRYGRIRYIEKRVPVAFKKFDREVPGTVSEQCCGSRMFVGMFMPDPGSEFFHPILRI